MWNNNTCIINNHHAYNFNFIGVEVDPKLVSLLFNNLYKQYPNVDYNTLYVPQANLTASMNGKIISREELEKYGSNKGTVVKDIKEITLEKIIEMGKEVLQMN